MTFTFYHDILAGLRVCHCARSVVLTLRPRMFVDMDAPPTLQYLESVEWESTGCRELPVAPAALWQSHRTADEVYTDLREHPMPRVVWSYLWV